MENAAYMALVVMAWALAIALAGGVAFFPRRGSTGNLRGAF
nr:MAG TPA: hypothetical protein [Caudoviricetes sp.]